MFTSLDLTGCFLFFIRSRIYRVYPYGLRVYFYILLNISQWFFARLFTKLHGIIRKLIKFPNLRSCSFPNNLIERWEKNEFIVFSRAVQLQCPPRQLLTSCCSFIKVTVIVYAIQFSLSSLSFSFLFFFSFFVFETRSKVKYKYTWYSYPFPCINQHSWNRENSHLLVLSNPSHSSTQR